MSQFKAGQYNSLDFYWDFNASYPYMWDPRTGLDVVDAALGAYDSAAWAAGDACARLTAAHSHGYNYNTTLRPENFFLYQEGLSLFAKPSGFPAITEAILWLGNAGEIFHTIHNLGRTTWVNQYDGLFNADCNVGNDSMTYLNNTWLEIVISVSSSVYHVIQLSRGDLATLNAQRGNVKTVAGLGSYSYMYSGSIPLAMPSQVISMLNSYSGVAVDIYWNWSDAILGPACVKCLHADYCSTHYDNYYWERINEACAAPWATRTALARLGDLEVR